MRVSGSVAILSLEVFKSLQIYKKYNRQRAGAELAIFTAYVLERQPGPRARLHALCHYVIMCWGRNNNNIGRFYFGGFSLNCQTGKFHQIFWLFGIY